MDTAKLNSHTLPKGYLLRDSYTIEEVLGEGGFGITYKACGSDGVFYAIKEYFPSGVATRDMSDFSVSHFEGKLATSFYKGLMRFLNEANTLKEFSDLGSIVKVIDVFEANQTAYIVMEYIEGITLKELIKNEGALPFDDVLTLFKPILYDLDMIHKKQIIHRDVSPDNIIVGTDNKLHLIDFGSVSVENPNESKTMTVILKAGFAPPEQYLNDGKIGAWTDVYSVSATIYNALTGITPPDSIRRMQKDELKPLPYNLRMNENQRFAVMKAMSLNYSERFKSTIELFEALEDIKPYKAYNNPPSTPKNVVSSDESYSDESYIVEGAKKRSLVPVFALLWIVLVLGMIIIPKALGTGNDTDKSSSSTDVVTTAFDQGGFEAGSNMTKLDDVTGMSYANAKNAIEAIDRTLEISTENEFSETIESGLVIKQEPAADEEYVKGELKKVVLTVSLGKESEYTTTEATTEITTEESTTKKTGSKKNSTTTKSQKKNTSTTTEATKKKSTKKKTSDDYGVIHLD